MIKQDAVAAVDAIGLAIVDRDPVGIKFRYGIGGAGVVE
jgi:hypothetical protein